MSTRMIILHKEHAKKKILAAAKFSEKLGAKLLGLGAFVPIVTEHGTYLQGKVNMSLPNGDAFSAVIAANVIKAAELAGLDGKNLQSFYRWSRGICRLNVSRQIAGGILPEYLV